MGWVPSEPHQPWVLSPSTIFHIFRLGLQIGDAFSGVSHLCFYTLQTVFGISHAPLGLRELLSIRGDVPLKVRKALLHSINRATCHNHASLHVVEFCPKVIKGTYLGVNRGDSRAE